MHHAATLQVQLLPLLTILSFMMQHVIFANSGLYPTFKAYRPRRTLQKNGSVTFLTFQRHDLLDNKFDPVATSQPAVSNNYNTINRGGSTAHQNENNESSPINEDNERYSRQLLTLGAQAHGCIRSATVYIDGPIRSGLVYECSKNLALSGVRHIVIVTNNDEVNEHNYHNPELDDLGNTYQNGARNEIFGIHDNKPDDVISDVNLLMEYIRRLNPGVTVSQESRSSIYNKTNNTIVDIDSTPAVLLCIDRPIPIINLLNTIARKRKWSFVATETAGVFGKVFCDFGTEFVINDIDGEIPVNTPLDHIDYSSTGTEDMSNNIVVHSIDGERHDVSKGDVIQFTYRDTSEQHQVSTEQQYIVVDIQTPYRIVVQPAKYSNNEQTNIEDMVTKIRKYASSFSRIKQPQSLSFATFDEVMKLGREKESLFTPCDLDKSFDTARRWTSLSCFQAMNDFVALEGRLPSKVDTESFTNMVKQLFDSNPSASEANTKLIDIFLRSCQAKFSPLQCVFGAISAQEVLKAITGLYNPIHQILLYDCDEIMDFDDLSTCNVVQTLESPLPDSSPALRYILGDDTVNKLLSTRVFVVGAGAIGCEILKNLASMGVGSANSGKVIITDMDSIEKSNLSRQLLFRDGDIGKFKSTAAHEAVLRMNSRIQIQSHSQKVGDAEKSDNDPFDEAFWAKSIDVILNALDNVEARLFMDRQCVTNKKALIDAGTMGPKGNVQVVVPFQSESYASSVDPPEPSIPICTLKNFPYAISHTIQWGRDLFEGLFQRRPDQANDFLENLGKYDIKDLSAKILREKGVEVAMDTSTELQEDLSIETVYEGNNLLELRKNAMLWATELASKLFYVDPEDLLSKHPVTSLDDEGLPFWSGSRRPPRSLTFNNSATNTYQSVVNQNFIEFVRHCARLRIESIISTTKESDDAMFTIDEARDACSTYFNNFTIHSSNKIESDNETKSIFNVNELLSKVVPRERHMTAIEFEKDDERNGHVAFVNAASNLRAMVYGIPTVDVMETRRIAGKIVPAMISTTAFVSAISCIELVKLVQKVELKRHRNAFINLALPFFAFTAPVPAETIPGLDGKKYTLWDQLSVKESESAASSGGITMKFLLKKIRKLASKDPANVQVVSISAGQYLLYANFLHEADKKVLKSPLWELIEEAISTDIDEDSRGFDDPTASATTFSIDDSYIDLSVVVEDIESHQELELPPVRVHRFKPL